MCNTEAGGAEARVGNKPSEVMSRAGIGPQTHGSLAIRLVNIRHNKSCFTIIKRGGAGSAANETNTQKKKKTLSQRVLPRAMRHTISCAPHDSS